MANKKTNVLDALVVALGNLSEVSTATRILATPATARKKSPYVGLIAGAEEPIVEDDTDVRFVLDVDIILLKNGRDIEKMLDVVKDLLYSDALAATIEAFQIRKIGQEEVALLDADKYSSTRIIVTITYVATKGAF